MPPGFIRPLLQPETKSALDGAAEFRIHLEQAFAAPLTDDPVIRLGRGVCE
jgi:hypothetical protein